MKSECRKIGMKPLCDHPSYCKNDGNAIYIGQNEHISHQSHFNDASRFPSGWRAIKAKFPKSFCTYTSNHGGHDKALCTTGAGSSWSTPGQNNKFMCASVTRPIIGAYIVPDRRAH